MGDFTILAIYRLVCLTKIDLLFQTAELIYCTLPQRLSVVEPT